MSMLKYLRDYPNGYEDRLNIDLMNKSADDPLWVYVLDAWKSLEICPNLKIVDYKYNTTESTIDINDHIYKRKKSQRKRDKVDYKFINYDRFGCLTIWIKITVPEVDPKTKVEIIKERTVKKDILIPLADEHGYYFIKGKRYYLLYQMLEKSTYTTKNSVKFKSLMPVEIQRTMIVSEDTQGIIHKLPVFNVKLFMKCVPIMLLYAAIGLRSSLEELYVGDIIRFLPSLDDIDDEKNIYFQISSKCYIEIDRALFDKYQYVQSIVGGLLTITSNRTTIQQLYDVKTWYKKLGNNGKPEKGKEILRYFQRMLDETTKKILKMHPYHTFDAYALIRYGMMNFNELRIKDNLSLENKRIRCNEYIASLLTKELSKKLNRVFSMGSKAEMINFVDMLKVSDDVILQKMH
ncbi:MAG TPA: hypothetical protein DCW90_03985 [Lachnospiraceae bacterium]|nr:hypothetical protein [Lachnospiraceae bacterium]